MITLKYISVAILILVLAACRFTEEINIKDDGSGSYNLSIDLSEMMGAMKGMKENDSIKKKPEKIDSIFYMREVIEANKDSISKLNKSERVSLEAIKDIKMHVQVDEEKGKMLMDFLLDFKKLSELDDIKERIKKAQQLQDKKGEKTVSIENHEVKYSYNQKLFKRRVIMKDLSSEDQEAYEKNTNDSQMFLSGSTYKLIYHFPREIKKVNFANTLFSADRKTMTIEVEIDSLLKNPQLLDIEVKF